MAQNALELYKRIKNDPDLQSQAYSLDDAGNLYDASGNRMGSQPQPQEQGFNRANFLPLVEYPDGRVEFGLPNILAAPLEGLQNFGRYGYDSPEAISDNARSTFDVAGSMATGSLAATPLKPSNALAAMGSGKGIRAYHGSPYDFDKFDINKIGTGEGHQAFGHGLYFAENEDVAKSYRAHNSATANFQYNGKPIKDELKQSVAWWLNNHNGDKDAVKEQWFKMYKPIYWERPQGKRELKLLEGMDYSKLKPGHMYEVNIQTDPSDLIDWDKPIGYQTPKIQEAIMSTKNDLPEHALEDLGGDYNLLYNKELTPENFLGTLQSIGGGSDYGEKLLLDKNVQGIKYLDQYSRGSGDGTNNYVIFNPDIVEILRKYMNPPTAAIVPFATQGNALEDR